MKCYLTTTLLISVLLIGCSDDRIESVNLQVQVHDIALAEETQSVLEKRFDVFFEDVQSERAGATVTFLLSGQELALDQDQIVSLAQTVGQLTITHLRENEEVLIFTDLDIEDAVIRESAATTAYEITVNRDRIEKIRRAWVSSEEGIMRFRLDGAPLMQTYFSDAPLTIIGIGVPAWILESGKTNEIAAILKSGRLPGSLVSVHTSNTQVLDTL